MRLLLVAAAGGALAGLALPRRPRHQGRPVLRGWLVLLVALGLQVAVARAAAPPLALVLASYAGLVAFALANAAAVAGLWLVAVGVGLNMGVIAANGAMPVRASALVRAGVADAGGEAEVGLAGKRRLEAPGDRLTALADVVPVRPVREVVSPGDLALAVGAADVLAHLVRRRPRPSSPAARAGGDRRGWPQ